MKIVCFAVVSAFLAFSSFALNPLQVVKITELISNVYSFSESQGVLAFIDHKTKEPRFLSLSNGKISKPFWAKPVWNLTFSEDGKRIAILETPGEEGGNLVVLNIYSNKVESIFEAAHDPVDFFRIARFSADGTKIYVLGDLEISAFDIEEKRQIALPDSLIYQRVPPIRLPVANMTLEEQNQYFMNNLTAEERERLLAPGRLQDIALFRTNALKQGPRAALDYAIKKTKEYKFMSMRSATELSNLSSIPLHLRSLDRRWSDRDNFSVISSNIKINSHSTYVMGLKNGTKVSKSLFAKDLPAYFYTKSSNCALSPNKEFVICIDDNNISPTLEVFAVSTQAFNSDFLYSEYEKKEPQLVMAPTLRPLRLFQKYEVGHHTKRVPRLQDMVIKKILDEIVPDLNKNGASFNGKRKFFINEQSLEDAILNATSKMYIDDIAEYINNNFDELLLDFYNDEFATNKKLNKNDPLLKQFDVFKEEFNDLNNKFVSSARKKFDKIAQRKFIIKYFSRDKLEELLSKISLDKLVSLPADSEGPVIKNFEAFLNSISVYAAIWPLVGDKITESHTFSEAMFIINQILISQIIHLQLKDYWRAEVREALPPIVLSEEHRLYIEKIIDLRVEQYLFPLLEKSPPSGCTIL